MNIGTIIKPNQKGQIVIPKTMRDKLHITEDVPLHIVARGNGIYIYPVPRGLGSDDKKDAYIKILKKTQGTWVEDWDTLQKQRRGIELEASKRRKKTW